MVEIKELPDAVEVVATGYRERFNNRFKAIMAAHPSPSVSRKRRTGDG